MKWIETITPKQAVEELGVPYHGWMREMDRAWISEDQKYSVMSRLLRTEWGKVEHVTITAEEGVGRSDGSGDIPWAVKMEIKNDLFGEKRVAVEVFPTQDRLVDVCDCYHLWVFEKGFQLPFGILLNRIGQLVCLTRQQAGAMIGSRELADNDDIYRVCLKYKAYVNSCRCTPNEIIEATKIIFGATEVVYSERRDVPATIYLSISAPFSDLVLSILGTHDLVVHPAGVRVRINCSTEDAETFGFVDLNPRVAGFGEGMFAQSIN